MKFEPEPEPEPNPSVEQLLSIFPRGITKSDLAKYYGLTSVDTVIPQQLFTQLHSDGPPFHPYSHYVYDYTFYRHGTLFPLTQEGTIQMENVFEPGFKFEDPRTA